MKFWNWIKCRLDFHKDIYLKFFDDYSAQTQREHCREIFHIHRTPSIIAGVHREKWTKKHQTLFYMLYPDKFM